MDNKDLQYLAHIRAHCQDIVMFIERFGNDFNVFTQDRAFFNAVAMSIMQIGELSNGLSDAFQEDTKDQMPWKDIRGMRNLLAHSYGEADESIVWDTAIQNIPELLDFCNSILK